MTLTESLWFFTPMLVSVLALLVTFRAQRMRLTVEDHEFLRVIIRYELAKMRTNKSN